MGEHILYCSLCGILLQCRFYNKTRKNKNVFYKKTLENSPGTALRLKSEQDWHMRRLARDSRSVSSISIDAELVQLSTICTFALTRLIETVSLGFRKNERGQGFGEKYKSSEKIV